MENYSNPNSTYGRTSWSENPTGYLSGYGMSERNDSDKKEPEMNYSFQSNYQKAEGEKPMSGKENGLGKMIYDKESRHPFCCGTGMSSDF